MQALVYKGNKTLVTEKVPIPSPGEQEVLIKVHYTGICGSDLLLKNGGYPRVESPLVPGHEFSGVIEEVGSSVSSFQVGDRVVVEPLIYCGKCHSCQTGDYNICEKLNLIGIDRDGGFADYALATEDQLYKVPDNISLKEASLVEPMAVCAHMLRISNLQQGDTAMFIGGGPIGLIAAAIAKEKGAEVFISEINSYRIEKAKELGFIVVNPLKEDLIQFVREKTNDVGVGIAYEVTGSNVGLENCIDVVKNRGTVLIAGMPSDAHTIDTYQLIKKEINVVGSRVYTAEDFKVALQLLEEDKFNPEDFITKTVTLDKAKEEGFDAIENGEPELKIIVELQKEER